MIALRRRLTTSYTVLVGAFIAVIAVAAAAVAFGFIVRQVADAIDGAAREARAIVASAPQISVDDLAARIRRDVARDDVDVYVALPPGVMPRFAGPPDGGPPGFPGPRGPGPPDTGGPIRPFEWFSNVRGEFVFAGSGQVAIVPDRGLLDARTRALLWFTALGVVAGFVIAWLIARRIAGQIVAPLVEVTAELRRFTAGDFAPNNVPLGRFSDVGELIDAYNGAAAQVSAAFDERERAEGRMRRFLADAGHEMRTPLSVITAYIDILRKGGSDDHQVRAQAFRTLASETLRMRRLVDRLVALARLEQPETTQPVPVEVGVLARDAVAAIVAARGGEVSCEVESGTYVLADPADLHEAIGNLVDNAVKYGAGSLVRVMVEHERDAVVVRISDCGPGIDAADREKIFERFYRGGSRRDADGSGLGLAIAARAATRAGGELALERSGDGETVFALRLPLHIAPNALY